jgi:hypothetical protein
MHGVEELSTDFYINREPHRVTDEPLGAQSMYSTTPLNNYSTTETQLDDSIPGGNFAPIYVTVLLHGNNEWYRNLHPYAPGQQRPVHRFQFQNVCVSQQHLV